MSEEANIPLPGSLQEIVGALLLASETPLSAAELREAVRAVEPQEGENAEIMDVYRTATSREMDAAIKGLGKALEVAHCGLRLSCVGGAYRIETVPSCGRYVRAMLKMDRPSRLGRATLETLAIVAYRQPITKGEVEEIRGVDVSGNIKTLMELGLIRLVGKSELPGHPFLYGTTPLFLEHFGLASLAQLNELDPTLQRSDPREKAASYRKPIDKNQMELTEAIAPEKPAEEEVKESKEEPLPLEEKGPALEASPSNDDDIFIDDTPDEFDDEDDDEEEEGPVLEASTSSDDDNFIDDTPDEFDDDDEEDDDDDEEEDDEEDDEE